jgi:hypothetical protein
MLASSSSDNPPLRPQNPRRSGNASRFLLSMRKSIAHTLLPPSKKRNAAPLVSKPSNLPHMIPIHSPYALQRGGMCSTLEEGDPHVPPRMHTRYKESFATRPTIEQIAMGLHVSHTPHLRNPRHQLHSAPSSPSHVRHPHDPPALHRPTHSLPPPPSRSSLKKAGTSTTLNSHPPKLIASLGASPSSSTISTSAATPDGARSLLSLKFRMSKLILGYRSAPTSPQIASMASSGSGSEGTRPTTPRKSVRFSTSVLALDDENVTDS